MADKRGRLKIGSDNFYPAPFFPIGSVYISVVNTNPSTWFGGTWVLFGQGKTLVGVDTSDNDFKTVEKTGGSKTTTHLFYRPPFNVNSGQTAPKGYYQAVVNLIKELDKITISDTYQVKNVGGEINATSFDTGTEVGYGKYTTDNTQPYITCYFWKRTA